MTVPPVLLSLDLATLPAPLAEEVRIVLARAAERLGASPVPVPDPRLLACLPRILAASPFCADYLVAEPAAFLAAAAPVPIPHQSPDQTAGQPPDPTEIGAFLRPPTAEGYRARIAQDLAEVGDEAALKRALRRRRRAESVRIAVRDIAGLAGLDETLAALSHLADALLGAALAWLTAHDPTHAEALRPDGGREGLVVLAMGKLGARELNFSSDIDLLFAYPGEAAIQGGGRGQTPGQYFQRLGQRLIAALHDRTEDGFVYRVDMRLRPFGEAGPLVASFAALEAYYGVHGRDWERYALIKARPVTGRPADQAALLDLLRPFVYRRYLDYGALESLREMKRLVDEEVRRKGLAEDIKRGPGGIREVEFIGQAFQLMRGGRDPDLRERGIRAILAHLGAKNLLPAAHVAELDAGYVYLRTVENRLQEARDEQCQRLPTTPLEQLRLAVGLAEGLGEADWETAAARLAGHRERVQAHFADLLQDPEAEHRTRPDGPFERAHALWNAGPDPAEQVPLLADAGCPDAQGVAEALGKLKKSQIMQRASRQGRQRLDKLLPLLLADLLPRLDAANVCERAFRLVEACMLRSVYLALLAENPRARTQLAHLLGQSAWIADLLTRQPFLLDELLDPRALYSPLAPSALAEDMTRRLARVGPGDLEQAMEVLRQFKHAQVLRVAAADLHDEVTTRTVSDYLSHIAEEVARTGLAVAEEYLHARHGTPQCQDGPSRRPARFGIVAYGKFGGVELGYGSDLDLVFLHDSVDTLGETDGPQPIANDTYFARLSQRFIHLLNTNTPSGRAYEVDTRLRPNGNAGLLVSSLVAFGDYQRRAAWTWEHQALIRARFVAGAPEVGAAFAAIRAEVLGRARDPVALRDEILAMRARMRAELAKDGPAPGPAPGPTHGAGLFDLKHGEGGITDLEFMVQYGVLRWASAHPALLRGTSNRYLLTALGEAGLLPEAERDALLAAYFAFRREVHHRALQGLGHVVAEGPFAEDRARVIASWRRWFAL
jgi:glutamate-ammonia-ligase adenylyltransferase